MINNYEFEQLVESSIANYKGEGQLLVAAVGALVVGRYCGWRALSFFISEVSFRKYQNTLGVIFKDVMPERTIYSKKSIGLRVADSVGNFWRGVQGRDKIEGRCSVE